MSEKKFPSKIFLEAFSDGVGSIRGTCGCCKRECYRSGDACYFDDGELEELEREAEKEPDKYADFGDESVSFGSVNGVQFVYGCPCEQESLYNYEAFVWSHRHGIIKYLVDVTKERKEEADENFGDAIRVEKVVKEAFKREEDFGREMECRALLERVAALIESTERAQHSLNIKVADATVINRFEALLKEMREIKSKLQEKLPKDSIYEGIK